jgi:hypothetical protein
LAITFFATGAATTTPVGGTGGTVVALVWAGAGVVAMAFSSVTVAVVFSVAVMVAFLVNKRGIQFIWFVENESSVD